MFFLFDVSVLEEEASVGVEVLLGMVYGARVRGAGVGGAAGVLEVEGRGVGVGVAAASSVSLSLDQSMLRGCIAFFCLLTSLDFFFFSAFLALFLACLASSSSLAFCFIAASCSAVILLQRSELA